MLRDREAVCAYTYVHKCTFSDSSDKLLNVYFIPEIPIDPGGYSTGKRAYNFQVHSSLMPARRPGSAVYKESKLEMSGRGWWVFV